MELTAVRVIDSPARADYVRLTGQVRYADDAAGEEYWLEVGRDVAGSLTDSGNPWLVWLLPLAVRLREPLRIELPVDGGLLERVRRVIRIWQAWYPELGSQPMEVEVGDHAVVQSEGCTAAFFSGGVDSLFTVLRGRESPASSRPMAIDDVIAVWGFDVPLEREAEFSRLRARLSSAATDLGKRFVDAKTNLRATRWEQAGWSFLAHGCALVGTGLALEGRYGRLLIGATGGYRDLHPWGSHPLTDPLLSTETTTVVHDGAEYTRTEKTELLTRSRVAMRTLRVCWESRSDENCGRCHKCLRTMLTLELMGALHDCSTFPISEVPLRRIAAMYCRSSWDFRECRDIAELARARGRHDVVRALRLAMRLSRVRNTWKRLYRWASNLIRRIPRR